MFSAVSANSPSFFYLECFVNDRSTVGGELEVDPEWFPESGIARPLLWAIVPQEDITVLRDPDRSVNWHENLKHGRTFLFPIHWWEKEQWKDFPIVERGKGWVASSFRTVFLDSEEGPLPKSVASRVMLKYHLEKGIPGVKGNRRLDVHRLDKCVRLSADLRQLVETGSLSPSLHFFEKPLGLAYRGTGVLFREVPCADLIPAFSFWIEHRRQEPIITQFLKMSAGSETIEKTFVKLIAQPLVDALLSAMSFGYGLEMHPQNICFRLVADGLPVEIYYRDLEGIEYSGKLRRWKEGEDPMAPSCNSEIYKGEAIIYRFFNRNYDSDLTTVLDCCIRALLRHGMIMENGELQIRREVKQIYRAALVQYGLERWDLFKGLIPWSHSPYRALYRRSHYYRRIYR